MYRKIFYTLTAAMLIFTAALQPITTVYATSENQETSANNVNSTDNTEVTNETTAGNKAVAQASIPESATIINTITITDQDGNPFDEANPAGLSDPANIHFDWSIPTGLIIEAGDTYEFDLPAEFIMYAAVSGTLDDYGTFTVDENGHVTMTFNENAATSDGVHGTLDIHTTFNEETINGSTNQQIEFPINDGINVDVNFKPKNGALIAKGGLFDQDYNGNTATWTINVNSGLDSIANATVTDQIPAGLLYNSGSLVVYQLNVNVDGSVTRGSIVDPSEYQFDEDGNLLSVAFNENPLTHAYQIEYKTDVENPEDLSGVVSFENNAHLNGDDINESAKSTITTSYGKPIDKTGIYDADTQTFNWEIRYNYNEQSIEQSNAWLLDTFPNSFDFNNDLQVYEVSIDVNGNETISATPVDPSEYTLTPSTNGNNNQFTLQFNQAIDKAYIIKYSTTVNPNHIIDENGVLTNSVTTGGGNNSHYDGHYNQHAVTKSLEGINYTTSIATWNIAVNGDNYSMHDVTINDVFSNEALFYIDGSLLITDKETGAILHEGVDYTFSLVDTPKVFKYTLIV